MIPSTCHPVSNSNQGSYMTSKLNTYLDFAVETAHLAGKLTLDYFQTGVEPDFKGDDTPVTIADRRAEQLIRSRIEKQFPGHAIVGEEYGETESNHASHRWYIDPIDGTKSFVRGVPLYAVLIGLEIEGTVEVGVAYFPALDEIITAATGEGCWWNGKRTAVSDVDQMQDALVVFGDVANISKYGRSQAWERIKEASYYRAGWGDAYGHLLVATGRAELMLDPIMNAWDCGPFPPILKEAGGYFGDWQGNSTIHANEAISTTKKLLPEVLELLQEIED
jgi:myo-inositol-1(or 4)-monophosphatase